MAGESSISDILNNPMIGGAISAVIGAGAAYWLTAKNEKTRDEKRCSMAHFNMLVAIRNLKFRAQRSLSQLDTVIKNCENGTLVKLKGRKIDASRIASLNEQYSEYFSAAFQLSYNVVTVDVDDYNFTMEMLSAPDATQDSYMKYLTELKRKLEQHIIPKASSLEFSIVNEKKAHSKIISDDDGSMKVMPNA